MHAACTPYFQITLLIPLIGTILWYIFFTKEIVNLQNLEISKWRIDLEKVARILRKFADNIENTGKDKIENNSADEIKLMK